MPTFRSTIDLQIPEVPAGVPDEWVPIFQGIYNALRNLQLAIGDTSGVGFTDLTYLKETNPVFSQSIQVQNSQVALLPTFSDVVQGRIIGLVNDGGILKIAHGLAAAGATQIRGWGWALESVLAGAVCGVSLLSGYNGNFIGLVPGTVYYLSDSSPGGISSAKPVGVGKIVQEVGVALSATEVLINLNTPITL